MFLAGIANKGWLAIVVCVIVGTIFTMLINASSATLAIVIGLASKGIINFEMAAAITLGANIGTTFDSFLVSLGANTNAKRAAWAHIMFNVIGTVWVVIVLRPFIRLVDWITPGEIDAATAGTHIAMMHTMFNLANTLVLLPFVKQYANLLERIIKSKPGEDDLAKLHYRPATLLASPELNLAQARSELAELARIADTLFTRLRSELLETNGWNPERLEYYERHCAYTTSMKEGLSKSLLEIARQDISDKTHDNISLLIRLVSDFENMCYACFSIASIKEKGSRKNMFFGEEEIQQLEPFTALTHNFLLFSKSKIGKPLSEEDLALAVDYENRVDACRSELKKLARRRIKKGSDVKAELMFIDLIRHIEKIGDNAYSVAVTLREMK